MGRRGRAPLRGFGLSLLVPDAHYARVADWVDRTHLRGRLVYYRVRERKQGDLPSPHPHALVRKLEIHQETRFYDWLEQELYRRFDIACCETLEQFRREVRAVTRNGQVKMPGERHERTTGIGSTIAVAMCWAGATPTRSEP